MMTESQFNRFLIQVRSGGDRRLRRPLPAGHRFVIVLALLLAGIIAPLSSGAGSAAVVPEGVWAGALLYAPFEYRNGWDNQRRDRPIGSDLVDQFNAALGGELVAGRYEADYEYVVFDLYAGLTARTTFHLQIPRFSSEVRQRVDIAAPPPLDQAILAQLEAMGFRNETLKGDGWGDAHLWLYHQYHEMPRLKLAAGAGWRTQELSTDFSHNTEKLNVGTRESEAALFNHVVDFALLPNANLNYRFELQYPLEGSRDVFRPGEGVVNVHHTPGRYMTHELELVTHWLARRVTATVGAWYREESASRIDGARDATGKDYLWGKAALGYDGMTDYEKGVMPIPLFAEVRYWHLERARNSPAYSDSYWEVWFAFPLWRR